MPEKFQIKVEETTTPVDVSGAADLVKKEDGKNVADVSGLLSDIAAAKEKLKAKEADINTSKEAFQVAVEGVQIQADKANHVLKLHVEGEVEDVYIKTSPDAYDAVLRQVKADVEKYGKEISDAWDAKEAAKDNNKNETKGQIEEVKDGLPMVYAVNDIHNMSFGVESSKTDFTINGPLVEPDGTPVGGYIEKGKKMKEFIDPKTKDGNFAVDNGIFGLGTDGLLKLIPYDQVGNQSFEWAFQSGPMLVVDGKNIRGTSTDKYNRSGIGFGADGKPVVIYSETPVTLHEFADLFVKQGCTNAIYLDGGATHAGYEDATGSHGYLNSSAMKLHFPRQAAPSNEPATTEKGKEIPFKATVEALQGFKKEDLTPEGALLLDGIISLATNESAGHVPTTQKEIYTSNFLKTNAKDIIAATTSDAQKEIIKKYNFVETPAPAVKETPVAPAAKEQTKETPDPILDVLKNLPDELVVKDGKIVLSDKGLAAIKEIGHLVNPSATPGLSAEAILVKELQQKKEQLLNGDKIEISNSDRRLGAKERKLRRVDREIEKIDDEIKKLQTQETKFDKKQVAANSSQAEKQNYNLYLNSINNYIKTKLLTKTEYTGKTYAFDSYVPLLANVCVQVNSPGFNGIAFVPGEKGGTEIPIYVQRTFDKNTDNKDLYGDEKEAPHKNGVVCGSNVLETYFRDHTNMSSEQAKKNANLITLAGIGTGLYFGIKWLFEKGKDGKSEFFGKAATIAGVLLGSNIAAEGLTGKSLTEIINGVWTGKLSWSDFADGKIFGKEKVADPGLTRVVILKNIPTTLLISTSVIEKGDNDGVKLNYDNLEKLLQAKLDKDPTNTNVKKQLEIVQELKKSESGRADLDKTLTGLGLTYSGLLAADKDATLDKTIDAVVARQKELRQLAAKNNTDYNYDDPAVHAYIYEGKGDKNTLPTKTNAPAVAPAPTPEVKKSTETPAAEKLDPALDAIDPTVAADLQKGLKDTLGTVDFKTKENKPNFEYDASKKLLSVSSYGYKTPIGQKDGSYRVASLELPFKSAKEAISTANLINLLILMNTGKWDTNTPFTLEKGTLQVGNAEKKTEFSTWLGKFSIAEKTGSQTEVNGAKRYWPWSNSTLETIGGKGLNSQADKFKDFLNKLGIWNKSNKKQIASSEDIDGYLSYPSGVSISEKTPTPAPAPNENGGKTAEQLAEEKRVAAEKAKKNKANKANNAGNKGGEKKEVVKKDPAKLSEAWAKNADFKKQTGIEDKAFYKAWADAYVAGKKEFSYNNKTYERQAGNVAPKEKVAATNVPEKKPEAPKKNFDVTKLIDTTPYMEKIQTLAKSFNFQDPLAKKAMASGDKLYITQGQNKVTINVEITEGSTTTYSPLGEIQLADVMSGADIDAPVLQSKVEKLVSRHQVEQTLKNEIFGDHQRNYPLNSFASKFPAAGLKDPVTMVWDGETSNINWQDKIGDSMIKVKIQGYNLKNTAGIDEDGSKGLVLRVDHVFTNGNFDASKLNKTLEEILHNNMKVAGLE